MNSTIVVIERDGWYLEQLARMLTWGGYRNTLCLPEASALAQLPAHSPDLIILGLYRGQNAPLWQPLVQLRARPALQSTPIILCGSDPDLWREALRANLTRHCTFLRKPLQIDLVLSEVRAQLQGLGARAVGA
ncbi:MAG: hypothetical protein OHK0022_14210 [Roseiflexaceae bacterium]